MDLGGLDYNSLVLGHAPPPPPEMGANAEDRFHETLSGKKSTAWDPKGSKAGAAAVVTWVSS